MKRDELEHVLRAAGAITGVTTWVIVGSQAILGAVPDAPAELLVSQEVDLYAPGDESASDLVDGSIGERSPFHDSFGYYGHGVGAETAVLPSRWRERALTIETPATGGVKRSVPSRTTWRSANSWRGPRRIRITSERSSSTGSSRRTSCARAPRSSSPTWRRE